MGKLRCKVQSAEDDLRMAMKQLGELRGESAGVGAFTKDGADREVRRRADERKKGGAVLIGSRKSCDSAKGIAA